MVLWSKTDGANAVRGIASLNSYPMYLNTRNPNVRSIQDFTNESRIAVPAVKVAAQAIALQMAAAKAFGESNSRTLDNRSEERRVGKERVRTSRFRWSQYT